jgi:MFS family permease
MRGRYMAISGLTWMIPATVGPSMAGFILDNYNPNLVWYIGGMLCLFAIFGFHILHLCLGTRQEFAPTKEAKFPLAATTD